MIINSNKTDIISMKVFDIVGNKIKDETFSIPAGGTAKNLQLQTGIYVAVLINKQGERFSNKILVQ